MSITLSGSSGIVGANGSVSAPALTGGDPASGIFFPAANTVGVSVGGVESFRANASGIFATANITATNLSVTNITPSSSYLRNRIINGDMRIDQRNSGGIVTQTTSNLYGVDRFQGAGSVTSKFTFQQSTTAPTGYVNSTLITSSAATTPGATDFYVFGQLIEGLNMADLAWGTANAATVTLSFWVRSSLTGTFGGSIQNSDNTRNYPFTYTISSANTWEQKTVTIAGDTSGTWLTTNGIGMKVRWSMGAGATVSGTAGTWSGTLYYSATGATSVVGTSGATFYITGVQLEVGTVATPFERRLYGQELMLCQRYYETGNQPLLYIGFGATGITAAYGDVRYVVSKRSTSVVNTATSWQYFSGGAAAAFTPTLSGAFADKFTFTATGFTNWNGWAGLGVWTASAEL